MLRAGTWVALLAFVVTLGAMSSAEARKWRGWRVHGFVHLAHPVCRTLLIAVSSRPLLRT
jgi:hypothetical protein